jgi:RHS repeat-associated protein
MTTIKCVKLTANQEWQATGVSVSSIDQRLTIIPSLVGSIRSYNRYVPASESPGQNGHNTGIWVPTGTQIAIHYQSSISAVGYEDYFWISGYGSGNEKCADAPGHITDCDHGGASDNFYELAPDGQGYRLPGAYKYSLVGRIGNGPWQYVGAGAILTPSDEGGFLYLGINDNDFSDNWSGVPVDICEGLILRARVGESDAFAVGPGFDSQAGMTGPVELKLEESAVGDVYVWVMLDALSEPECKGSIGCLFGHAGADDTTSNHPISLRRGEKRLSATDLSVETPAGKLTFERSYRQSKQEDADFQFMGLGWTHNHRFKLTLSGTSPNRAAEVVLPQGGLLKLVEDSGNAGHFDALSGSTVVMDYAADYFGAGSHAFLLTATDKTVYAFDAATLRLKQREWPDSEAWIYTHDGGGNLTEVDDGHGRKLKFAYYSTGDFKNDQLWRVGDQSATGLDTGSPAGRYIEFDYTPEKVDGSAVGGGRALLSSVKDVRGEIWTFAYYGESSDEKDTRNLNYLVGVRSPDVDADGDGGTDGTAIRNRLAYYFNLDLAANGDMEVDEGWMLFNASQNTVNELSTAQVDQGSTSRHVRIESGEGLQSEPFNLVAGRTYTITAKTWRVSGSDHVTMHVTDTNDFDATTQGGAEQWETVQVVHRPTSDLPDVFLQFLPTGLSTEFYLDSVSIVEERDLAVNGGMEVDDGWSDIAGAEPTTNERSTAQVDAGTYARHVNADTGEGIESEAVDLAAGVTYVVAARVYPVSGTVKMGVSNTGDFDTTTSGTGAWETLRAVHTPTSDLNAVTLQFTASSGAAEFYVDAVSVLSTEPDIAQITQERGVWTPDGGQAESPLEVTTFTFQPGGQNVTLEETAGKTKTHYFANGVYLGEANPAGEIAPQVSGSDYRPEMLGDGEGNVTNLDWSGGGKLLAGVTDALGGRTTFAYDADDRLHRQRDAEGRETVYVYADADASRKPSQVMVVQGRNLAQNGGMEEDVGGADISGAEPLTNERSDLYVSAGNYSRHVDADAAGEGIEGQPFDLVAGRTYTIRAMVYVDSGTARLSVTGTNDFDATTSNTDVWEVLEVTHRPASGLTDAKLQITASGGAAEFYVDAVEIIEDHNLIVTGGMEIDGDWADAGTPTANARSDVQVDTGVYARHVACDAADEGIASVVLDLVADRTYAIFARIYPVSGMVKMGVADTALFDATTNGSSAWETLFVYAVPGSDLTGKSLQFLSSGGAAEFYVDSVLVVDATQIQRWQAFDYDANGRVIAETLERVWTTDYADLPGGGGARETLTDPVGYQTRRDFDRLGRLAGLAYLNEAPKLTPDVTFGYDAVGNRVRMSEDDGASAVRETVYHYDGLRRLTQVDFDEDGDGAVENSVGYEYDAGGLRTRLVMPGGLTVGYEYDRAGRLVRLSNWDHAGTGFAYDLAGRLIAAERSNGLHSRYAYDAGGNLRLLRHASDHEVLGHFAYEVDPRGNRIEVLECLPHPGTGQTTVAHDDDVVEYVRGSWSVEGGFRASADPGAAFQVAFFGDEATLTLGVGPDHGLVDVRVDGMLWRSFDGYAVSEDERDILIGLEGEGPHDLTVESRWEKNLAATGYRLRFKELVANRQYTLHTIEYAYDAISRLAGADTYPGRNTGAQPLRQYAYGYDLAGNRIQKVVTVAGAPTTTNYTYNDLNQLIGDGTNSYTYDDNGNLTLDGTNAYTWDRANRLLSMGGHSYAYNGLGQRVGQTVDSVVTQYLLDVQPGLWTVLAATTSGQTERYIHGPMGIHAQEDPSGGWRWAVQDALGSVRGEVDAALDMQGSRGFSPYGEVFGAQGAFASPYAFTGEPLDANGLVHLRARYYDPVVGRFSQADPSRQEANLYQYGLGNPVKYTDPSGLGPECPITAPYGKGPYWGEWDCPAVNRVFRLRKVFLDSAERHNQLPNMDDNAFAALIATVIIAENRLGRVVDAGSRNKENFVAWLGSVVSGNYIREAYDQRNVGLLIGYMTNCVIPDTNPIDAYASVGIGNIKIPIAANIWQGQACDVFGECVPVDVSPLKIRNKLGVTIDVDDPYAPTYCTDVYCTTEEVSSELEAFENISLQLLNRRHSIEYVAAILEAGALRARSRGEIPTAYSSVLWYVSGTTSREEQERSIVEVTGVREKWKHAAGIIDNVTVALQIMGLSSTWRPDNAHEPDYASIPG